MNILRRCLQGCQNLPDEVAIALFAMLVVIAAAPLGALIGRMLA